MRIVVGVDGSDASYDALRWARREALAHHASLNVVCAWAYPIFGILPLPDESQITETLAENAHNVIRTMLDRVAAEQGGDVETHSTVAPAAPAAALLKVAEGADLLVVGARGFGGFAGLLLGSVSQQCVNHATCPVVVVHARQHQ
jgi:nucleotide-binding universal stress UspA family protein